MLVGYDVARLSAEDPRALQRWLSMTTASPRPWAPNRSCAPIPPRAGSSSPSNWRRAGHPTESSARFGCRSRPSGSSIRRLNSLAKRHLALRLYVAADREVEIPRLRTIYAGRVSELERPPPAGVRRLLRAPFLTRMERDALDPSDLRADLVARPVREGGGGDGGPSAAAWLAIGLGGAALIAAAAALAAASVRRRRA